MPARAASSVVPTPSSRTDTVLDYISLSTKLLRDISDSTNLPYLKIIAGVSVMIVETIQESLYRTLEKLLSYVRIQAEGNCKEGMKAAMDNFGIRSTIITAATLAQIQAEANRRHQEIMGVLESKTSTLKLGPEAARIAILGQGGIGKTSLALAALHHGDIIDRYPQRYFIACDSSGSVEELHNAMTLSLGIENARKPGRAIVEYFEARTENNDALLVLDNFESPWEGPRRPKTEEFLSALCGVKRLSVIVTIRGTERPSGPRWTRPFLSPLQPLSFEAAKSIFVEISDEPEDDPHIPELLHLTDNLPLAVKLLAQLASFEGCASVLLRWKEEKAYLYTDGEDKTSNLDISIGLSLSSPRFRAHRGARELLTAIALLPDGISDAALKQIGMPILGILKSLAYVDNSGRLKCLTPIREYMLKIHPPSLELYAPLGNFRDNPPTGLVRQINSNLGNIASLIRFALELSGEARREALRCVIKLTIVDTFTGFDTTSLLSLIKHDVEELEKDEWGGWYWYAVALSVGTHDAANHRTNLWNAVHVFEAVGNKDGLVRAYNALALSEYSFHYDDASLDRVDIMACMEKSIQASIESKNARLQGIAHHAMAQVWKFSGKLYEALKSLQEAKDLAKVSGSSMLEIRCLIQEGSIHLNNGNFTLALTALKQSTAIFTALGVEESSPATMTKDYYLAAVYYFKSEYSESRNVLSRLSRNEGAGDPTTKEGQAQRAQFLISIIEIDLLTGRANNEHTLRDMASVELIQATLGTGSIIATDHALNKAHIKFLSGKFVQARDICRKEVLNVRYNAGWTTLRCIEMMGDICLAEKKLQFAMNQYIMLILRARNYSQPYVHSGLRRIGDIFVNEGDDEVALSLFEASVFGYEKMDIHRGKADCMLRIGDIAFRKGDVEKAKDLWCKAIPLFQRAEQYSEAELCKGKVNHLQLEGS
ncbi:hypothetical protein BDQ17DRAFT_1327363 [Cyathus striatus]|nr:hypothetical protein BDQ17DRAFT_1327363 [Cyathus striatus]